MGLLLLLLVFLLPTQLGKHFWPSFAFVHGRRIDYLSPTLYLTDLIVLMLLVVYLFKKKFKFKWSTNCLAYCLLFIVFCLLNSFFAFQPLLAIYGWLRIIILISLFFLLKNLDYSAATVVYPLASALLYSSGLAILQFIKQASVGGWFYWLGERELNLALPQVAREVVGGRLIFPSYASFSHPNSLAGFLLIGFLILIQLGLLKKKPWFFWLTFYLSLVALILTFSYTVYLTAILVAGFLVFLKFFKKLSLKTNFSLRVFFSLLVFSFLVPGLLNLCFKGSGLIFLQTKSVNRRIFLNKVSLKFFKQSPLLGTGMFHFIPQLGNYGELVLEPWLQPTHHTWLLFLVEIGIVGAGMVFLVFLKSFKKAINRKNWFFAAAILAIVFIGSFDHYWLTLPQNRLLLVFLFALIWKTKIAL